MGNSADTERELSAEEIKLVAELNEMGAATPIQLALRLRAQPDAVRPRLRKLKDEGLLDVHRREGFEKEIYSLSSKGRSAINHP